MDWWGEGGRPLRNGLQAGKPMTPNVNDYGRYGIIFKFWGQ
jgi:hypothetical protein